MVHRCLDAMESAFIMFYDSTNIGYNVTNGGRGNNCEVTEETRRKLSLASKGKHYSPKTEFKKNHIP